MAIAVEDITPSLTAIASYILNRTYDETSTRTGTFNETTTPTVDEAAVIATRAARHVALRLGTLSTTWTDEIKAAATDTAAVYAALQIELGYFTDGSGAEGTAITDQLGRMFREQLAALTVAIRDNRPGAWRIHSIPMVSTSSPAAYREPSVVGDHLEPEQLVNGPDGDED